MMAGGDPRARSGVPFTRRGAVQPTAVPPQPQPVDAAALAAMYPGLSSGGQAMPGGYPFVPIPGVPQAGQDGSVLTQALAPIQQSADNLGAIIAQLQQQRGETANQIAQLQQSMNQQLQDAGQKLAALDQEIAQVVAARDRLMKAMSG